MKLRLLIVILLLIMSAPSVWPQQSQQPLTKGQVMDLVKFGMPAPDLAAKIKKLGIDFEPTDDYLQALMKAGAGPAVIQALRAVHPKALTREQVGKLVAGGVPSERAAALVNRRGIDFQADEEYLNTLRLAGADDTLIAALREANARATAQLVVLTAPNAEVLLDGGLHVRANEQGELVLKVTPGAHALKITLAGKQDFEQSVTLAAQQATKIEARLEDVAPPPGTVRENPKDGLPYAWIPPGSFQMGCSSGGEDCQDNEKPAHPVTLSKGYWLGQTEVTVGAYQRFAEETGRRMPPEPGWMGRALNPGWGDKAMPIVDVTWDEAQTYCSWAGGRLPTEAEWEYAARAGSTEARYGDLDEIAWYAGNSGRERLDITSLSKEDYLKRINENGNNMHEVGQKQANGFGLYDVLGNVWEWVNDWFDETYYQNRPAQDPPGPEGGQNRSLRGGAWYVGPTSIHLSYRYRFSPGSRNNGFGFRCSGGVFKP
jgi:formylglycine-generating enzyme required for sulfatase activity